MSEFSKGYDPREVETRWYERWMEAEAFKADAHSDKPAYTIVIPPPNVTGSLHMGHALTNTIQDVLIRWKRMSGFEALWLPGTDHAGIATQMVVERDLKKRGLNRREMGREAFLEHTWLWKEKYGNRISMQLRRLGSSLDWSRERFTMDEGLSKAVREVFVRLWEEGLIYQDDRLVNWDPAGQTVLSDLEVEQEEEDGFLWHIAYPVAGSDERLVVATTRPETLLGDTAVAVNPADPRYLHLHGKEIALPLTDRRIPIIADGEAASMEFGSGAVKITPAHDFNDFETGRRHNLPRIAVLDLDAKMNGNVPERFRGLDRFEARKRIVEELTELGLLVKVEPHKFMPARSQRTGVIVEPLSVGKQWYVKMQPLAEPAIAAVREGKITFVPEGWEKTYYHWMENIRDWCISRQLWWGHQIPAWYKADDTGAAIHDGTVFVARDEDGARQQAVRAGWQGALVRDADVLDTWFSSALVPFSSLGWPNQSPDLARYLPSSVLVTGFDIIFFWVARMVMMTTFFTGKVPFRDVYINAIVRDAEGQKMSKSKGNTIDPLDLIDGITLERLLEKSTVGLLRDDHKARIAKSIRKSYPSGIPAYGADAVRFTFASLATFARTLNFDLNRCEGYRNFCNKLWNATRFVLMQTEGRDCGHAPHTPDQCVPGGYLYFTPVDRWISSQLQRVEASVEAALSEYRFDNAAREIYEFVWNNYCDWYLELAKVNLASPDEAVQRATRRTLLSVLETILRLAHPIIPFITEELWQKVAPLANRYGEPGQVPLKGVALEEAIAESRFSIMSQRYPVSQPGKIDTVSEAIVAELRQMIDACRALRGEMTISPAVKLPLVIAGDAARIALHAPYLQALAKLSGVVAVAALPHDSIAPVQIVGDFRLMLQVEIDVGAERDRLDREIERVRTEVNRAQGKLGNAGFVDRAPPAVVAQERERLAGFETTLARLIEQRGKLD